MNIEFSNFEKFVTVYHKDVHDLVNELVTRCEKKFNIVLELVPQDF